MHAPACVVFVCACMCMHACMQAEAAQPAELHDVLSRAHAHVADGSALARVSQATVALDAATASASPPTGGSTSSGTSSSSSSRSQPDVPSGSSGLAGTPGAGAAMSPDEARAVLEAEERTASGMVDELDRLIAASMNREVSPLRCECGASGAGSGMVLDCCCRLLLRRDDDAALQRMRSWLAAVR